MNLIFEIFYLLSTLSTKKISVTKKKRKENKRKCPDWRDEKYLHLANSPEKRNTLQNPHIEKFIKFEYK